jgi:Putative phage tail protein
MGGAAPSPFSNAFEPANVHSLRYNTAQFGSVVPVLWGTHRLGVNLIDEWGFSSHGGGKGGKGGGGGSSGGKKGGSQYSVDVAFALCEGPCSNTGAATGVGGENLVWSNGGVGNWGPALALNFYAGNAGQAADPVFAASDPKQPVPGYSSLCYVTGTPMYLGGTPALPSIQFQLGGQKRGTCLSFPDDARPDAVISDLLTNASYGAGFPAANLASLADAGTWCQARSLAVSLLCDRQDSAARWLSSLLDACALGAFFSGSELKIVPFASTAFLGNSTSWTPDLTVAYALGDGDFLDWESAGGAGTSRAGGKRDPIEVTRKNPAEQANWLSIEYNPAVYWYNRAVAFAADQRAIAAYGLRLAPNRPGNFFTNPISAQVSAWLQLGRTLYNLNQYRFRLNISKCLLEPMDILELTESVSGLVSWPVRVVAVEEDEESTIIVTAEDLFEYEGAGVVPPPPAGTTFNGLGIDSTAAPGSTNPPAVFEPPYGLTGGDNEVWIVASGGPDWGGCEVWVSLDGSSYGQYGTIYAGGRQGALTADFPAHADPDNTDTLSVDLSESRGTLNSGTAADADAFLTLCWVGGELVSYETATATAPQYHYDLGTHIRRGAYGTTIADHPLGTQFARLDNAVFKIAAAGNLVSQTFYLKLPAFNLFGNQLEDLAAVAAYSYTLTGAGTQPGSLYVAGSESGQPAAGATLQNYTFARQATFPVGFAGSVASAQVAASNPAQFEVLQNGFTIGAINFAAGAAAATFILAAATTFNVGDVLSVVAPSPQDATLADVSWTLVATT